MKTQKINFANVSSELSRSEMREIMAGSDCQSGTMTCEEFHRKTGCYPTITNSSCTGTDGCTYSFASSSGSCG